jgi:hypothetical protein
MGHGYRIKKVRQRVRRRDGKRVGVTSPSTALSAALAAAPARHLQEQGPPPIFIALGVA